MPPTRRLTPSLVRTKRKITRRRTRKTTWLDLLQLHNSTETTLIQRPAGQSRPRRGGDAIETRYDRNMEDRQDKTGRGVAHEALSEREIHETERELESMDMDSQHGPTASAEEIRQLASPSLSYDEHPEDFMATDSTAADIYPSLPTGNSDSESRGQTTHEPSSTTATADVMRHLEKTSKFALTASNIIALTLICGSVKFSVQQYEVVRSLIKHSGPDTQLPCYSTVQRKLVPHLLQNCFPQSTVHAFPKKGSTVQPTSDRSVLTENIGDKNSQSLRTGRARVVYPTEWAKLDVATLPYFDNIFGQALFNSPAQQADPLSLEHSLIIRDRSAITDVSQKLFVVENYGTTPASPGDTISFRVENGLDDEFIREIAGSGYHVRREQEKVSITSSICATWCVGAPAQVTKSASLAIEATQGPVRELVQQFSSMQPAEDFIITRTGETQNRRSRQRFFNSQESDLHKVRGGDICTLFSTEMNDNRRTLYCMLVSHFWKPREGIPSLSVLWIGSENAEATTSEDSRRPSNFKVIVAQSVEGTPQKSSPGTSQHDGETNFIPRGDSGTLKDGRPYVVYRVLLYCDDFKESASTYSQSSAGGVYLLPLGMSLQAKSSRTAVHIISLTPPGVSTNEILHHIIPDLVKGTKGVEGRTPSGMEVMIFIDVVGFVADYPAAAAALDVIGHTGDAPCTHCNIRKLKTGGSSQMGHTTDVNAVNTATMRSGERHTALRNCAITNREANLLGMKPSRDLNDRTCPLLAIQREIEGVRPLIPKNSHDRPVVPGMFDAYRSSLIAPDHLLTGLARNVLDLCFHMLTPDLRKRANVCICAALADNGLFRERTIFNHDKQQLHTTSLSALYCILLVAPPILSNMMPTDRDAPKQALSLLTRFQKLVAMTHWNPSRQCEGDQAYLLPRMQDGRPYVATLQSMAEDYVRNADAFFKRFPDAGSVLDKPNLHRLLELYHHTIPAFGHVCHTVELVFEAAHQPLKRCISTGNHHDAEASAVVRCLGNDWQSRIFLLQHFVESPDKDLREKAVRGLRRLLLGKGGDCIPADSTETTSFMQKVERDIRKLFVTPLLHILKSNGNANTALVGRTSRWVTMVAKQPGVKKNMWDLHGLTQRGKAILEIQLGHYPDRHRSSAIHWKAKRATTSALGPVISKPFDVIEPGSVVQAVLSTGEQRKTIVRPHGSGDCAVSLFVILGFVDGISEGPWAVTTMVHRKQDRRVTTPNRVGWKQLQMLKLNNNVRRVGVYHVCDYNVHCEVDFEEKSIKHGEHILSGGTFYVQSRNEGYPPRMA